MIPEYAKRLDCASPSAFAARHSAAKARRRLALCKQTKCPRDFRRELLCANDNMNCCIRQRCCRTDGNPDHHKDLLAAQPAGGSPEQLKKQLVKPHPWFAVKETSNIQRRTDFETTSL